MTMFGALGRVYQCTAHFMARSRTKMCDNPIMTEPTPWNYAELASQFIRALRGKRSQLAFSRRLGYRTNILYVWEAARGAPTAAGFMRVAARAGVDLERAFATFYRS